MSRYDDRNIAAIEVIYRPQQATISATLQQQSDIKIVGHLPMR
jgi:hypothetical protein